MLQNCTRLRTTTISTRHDSNHGWRWCPRWLRKMRRKGIDEMIWSMENIKDNLNVNLWYVSTNKFPSKYIGLWSWKDDHQKRILSQEVFCVYQMQKSSWIFQRHRRTRWWGKISYLVCSLLKCYCCIKTKSNPEWNSRNSILCRFTVKFVTWDIMDPVAITSLEKKLLSLAMKSRLKHA